MRDHKRTDPGVGRSLLSVLRRRWLLVIVPPVLFGLSVYITQSGEQARYQSTAKVLLQTNDLGAVLAGVPDLASADPARALATEQEIASVPEVRRRAEVSLGAAGTELAKTATISFRSAKSFSEGDSDIFDVTVTANAPTFAEVFASAVARQYIAFRTEVTNSEITKARQQVRDRMAQIKDKSALSAEYTALVARAEKLDTLLLLGSDQARLLSPGETAAKVAPEPVRRGIVAAVLGLLVGIVAALGVERLDTSVRTDDEMSSLLGAPILARLPDPRRLGPRGTVIALSEPQSAETEAFRLLRANLRFGLLGRQGHSVGITSGEEAEGKSFVAANLAVVAAAAGASVVLVDLDLRRPTLHRLFGVERSPGLSDILTGTVRLEDALTVVGIPADLAFAEGSHGSLCLLSAGVETPNPGEVVASMALKGLLQDLEDRFELVVVDTPPVLVVNDAIPISSALSGVITVVRVPQARRPRLAQTSESLAGVGGSMGVVLTAAWRAHATYASYTTEPIRAQR